MQRRLLFTAAAAGMGAALAPATAVAETLDRGLAVDLDYWEERTAALGRDHMNLGAAVMRPKLFDEILMLDSANHGGQLTGHIARLTVLYARTTTTTVEADAYHQRARQYAALSGDAATIAWVNGRIALGLSDNPTTAHRTSAWADLALERDRGAGAIGALGVYLAHYAKARAAAVLGDADPALAHLEQARYAYDAIDPETGGSEWSYNFARFASDNSYVLEAVGRAQEAAHWAEQAREAGVEGRFVTHLALHALVGRHRAGDRAAGAEASALMGAIEPAQQSVTLRQVAVQAGAREYLGAA